MADLPDVPRPSQLWKQLSAERRLQTAHAFWGDDQAGAEQAEAILLIAQRIKFRPKSVAALPRDKKARYLATLPGVSELVAARLLVVYHLEQQRPMMGRFLDAAGIAHDNGLISQDDVPPPPREQLQAAVSAIAAEHPAEDVSLYLSTLVWQDPDAWGELASIADLRPR